MSMHIAQIRVYAHGQLFDPGDPVFYDGRPTWQYEPTEPAARAEWLEKTADADKVRAARFEAAGRWGDPWQLQPSWAPPRPEVTP